MPCWKAFHSLIHVRVCVYVCAWVSECVWWGLEACPESRAMTASSTGTIESFSRQERSEEKRNFMSACMLEADLIRAQKDTWGRGKALERPGKSSPSPPPNISFCFGGRSLQERIPSPSSIFGSCKPTFGQIPRVLQDHVCLLQRDLLSMSLSPPSPFKNFPFFFFKRIFQFWQTFSGKSCCEASRVRELSFHCR